MARDKAWNLSGSVRLTYPAYLELDLADTEQGARISSVMPLGPFSSAWRVSNSGSSTVNSLEILFEMALVFIYSESAFVICILLLLRKEKRLLNSVRTFAMMAS